MSDCDPMDCSLPGSSIHGIFQARVLKWVATSFSRGSSRPRHRTQVSHIAGRRLPSEPPGKGSRFGKETGTISKYKRQKQELNSNPDTRVMVFYFTIFIKEQVTYTISCIPFVINYLYLTKRIGHESTF